MSLTDSFDYLSNLDPNLPHASNLKNKIRHEIQKPGKQSILILEICEQYKHYLTFIQSLDSLSDHIKWINGALKSFEYYYSFIKKEKYNKCFTHQSDFHSSLLPEFLYIMYKKFIVRKYDGFIVETQKEIIIDLSFLPNTSTPLYHKSKRVDVAVLKPSKLQINDQPPIQFSIPIVAVEVKTNLDKNMISGVEYSVQRLKRTFPLCKYFLISEYADFAFEKQNYASSPIDEILITRKQKRIEVRNDINKRNAIHPDLLISHLVEIFDFTTSALEDPTILNERLLTGKLIRS